MLFADAAAVLMEEGVANLCLITGHMTVVRANVTQAIPKKRRGSTTQHDKALLRFYEATLQVLYCALFLCIEDSTTKVPNYHESTKDNKAIAILYSTFQ